MSRIAYSLLLLPLLAAPVSAQTQGPVVTGLVRDSAGRPIPGAEVFVGKTDKPVTTNEAGRFRVAGAPSGPQWVAARRIGYAPVRRSVRIMRDETQQVDLVMTALPLTLPELKVVEQSGMKNRRLEDFWQRSRFAYGGRFITGEDLERRNPVTLAQVVRQYLPNAALTNVERSPDDQGPMWGYQQTAVYGSRMGRRCAPAVSVDGSMASDMWTVEDIPVGLVGGLEIYRPRWSEMPTEYSFTSGRAMQCGLVVVWTK
jgi:hypothetical protein